MGNFFKVSGIIIGSLLTLFVFVFFIRFKTANTPFISTKAIAVQFSTYDMWEPWYNFLDFAKKYQDDFVSDIEESENLFNEVHWNQPTYKKINNPSDLFKNIGTWFSALFNVFGQFFSALGNLIISLGKTIGLAFAVIGRFLFSLLHWLGYVFWSLFDFLNFILTA